MVQDAASRWSLLRVDDQADVLSLNGNWSGWGSDISAEQFWIDDNTSAGGLGCAKHGDDNVCADSEAASRLIGVQAQKARIGSQRAHNSLSRIGIAWSP